MLLNLILIFLMIFVANKTREIEKNNYKLKTQIIKISENIKINKLELTTHQNSSYLKKMYSLYFPNTKKNIIPNIISYDQLSIQDQNIKLVKTKK